MRAVVFDFDGVLVDSEPLHYRALREALLGDGIAIDEDEYRRHYLAYDDRESIRIALERHGRRYSADQVAAVAARKAAAFETLLQDVPFYPGARELIGALSAEVPLAIASGARREEIERLLRAGGLRDSFRAVVGAEDVARSKPDPAPYRTAFQRLAAGTPGLSPGQCLAFEDSVPGILSAREAGLKVVGVAHTYAAEALRPAHQVIGRLEGLDVAGVRALFARC